MFQLTDGETAEFIRSQIATLDDHSLRSQFATSKAGRGGRRYRPFAFTEHGAVMLACVLKSAIAIEASVQVVRAFNRLKEYFMEHKELALKLNQVEKKLTVHDHQIQTVFQAITKLQKSPRRFLSRSKPKRPIGFRK